MVVTFLPYPDFKKSIESLDNTRCAKQRLEAYQMINAIMKKRENPMDKVAWSNHPACLMWVGYENALIQYFNICLDVWESRGKSNSMKRMDYIDNKEVKMPWWVGWHEFHESHKASLLRKHPYFYSKLFTVHEYFQNRGYVWPSHHSEIIREKLEMYPRQGFEITTINRTHYSNHSKINDSTITTRDSLCVKYKIFAEINKDTMKSAEKSKYLLYTIDELRKICELKLDKKTYLKIKKLKKTELFDYCENSSLISI